jgi:hypothetical protein
MQEIGPAEFSIIVVVIAVFAAIVVIPYWRIFGRAGFSPALSLLMFIPLVNIIALYYLAFAQWPSLKQGKM